MEIKIKEAKKQYDVIVAGGGPAGILAAIAAARMGAKTLLVEAGSAVGGMATLGMVSKFAPFSDQVNVLAESLTLELVTRYKKMIGLADDLWRWLPIYPEELKRLYDDMLKESGVEVLLHTVVSDVEMENGKITALICANKGGIFAYRAKQFIDCTGDADVCYFAGVPCEYGDEDHYVQEASLCFAVSNVHPDRITRPIQTGREDNIWLEAIASGKYPGVVDHCVPSMVGADTMVFNAGGIENVNATDPEAVSEAMRYGRFVASQYLQVMKDYQPDAFCDATLVETAPLLGVRESRRIIGKYVLTAEDYFARRSFDDEIGRDSYWLDCHLPAGKENPCEIEPGKFFRYQKGESHGIPFSCLVPNEISNLLVAGRCVSMDRMVSAAMRVMPNCFAEGEAVGIGAVLAIRRNIPVQALDGKEIRKYYQ